MSEQLKAILEQIQALDELKQDTLKNYINKAKEDKRELDSAAKKAGAAEDQDTESLLQNKKEKRQAGIENAQSRTFKKDVKEATEPKQGDDLGLDKFSQDALVKHKAKLKREKNNFDLTNKLNQKPVAESAELEGLEDLIEQIEALDEVSKKELEACMTDGDDENKEDEKKEKKSSVKESVEALVSAILDGDDATAAFNTAMAEKVTSAMDAMKVDIASQLTK